MNLRSKYEVFVSWLGFDERDSTWEPLRIINADIPDKLKTFFDRSGEHPLVSEARQTLV